MIIGTGHPRPLLSVAFRLIRALPESARVNIQRLNIKGHEYTAAVWTDITDRKRAEARLVRDVVRTEFLLEMHQRAPQMKDDELYNYVFERAVKLAESSIGFFHQVTEDQSGIILTAWNEATLRNCSAAYETHYPVREAGNWMDCIREQALGYKVHSAANGREAPAIWGQCKEQIELLFADMVMPGEITGLDRWERLRKLKPDLKAVISSG